MGIKPAEFVSVGAGTFPNCPGETWNGKRLKKQFFSGLVLRKGNEEARPF